MSTSSDLPPQMRGDNPQAARFRPTAQANPAITPVGLGVDLGDVVLPEAGYPDAQEAGLRYAAGQRMQARQTENRGALTSSPGDPTTPTMYPTDYGYAGTGSPVGTSTQPAAPAGPGTVATKAAADEKAKKAEQKKAKRKHKKKRGLAGILPPRSPRGGR